MLIAGGGDRPQARAELFDNDRGHAREEGGGRSPRPVRATEPAYDCLFHVKLFFFHVKHLSFHVK